MELAEVCDKRGRLIAYVYVADEHGDQNSTAALFAAAPELLAALREVVAVYDKNITGYFVGQAFDKARAAIAKATAAPESRAAIAKATGEKP
jgi:hypothetical protein